MKRYVVDGLDVSCFCQGVMPFGTGVRGSDMSSYFAKEEDSLTGHAFDNPTSRQRHRRARELAAELDATPNQIALAWLMARPFPVIPILGTTKRDHLADALGAAAIHLTSEHVQWLRDGV